MCRDLHVGFLKFSIIISVVLSHNKFVGPCLENPRSSRMENIYFVALAPETAAINSSSVHIVATVACILLLLYTAAQNRVVKTILQISDTLRM